MIQQASLNFLGDDTMAADTQLVDAIIRNISTTSQVMQVRDRAKFILGAQVGQEVRYQTLPYKVEEIYTKKDNQDNIGGQLPFFLQDIGRIKGIKLLEARDYVRPTNYTSMSNSSSSLEIDHECFFPTEHIELCTRLIQPFMLELKPRSYIGSEEIVKLWTQLCLAEGNIVLFRKVLVELENSLTRIYKATSRAA